MFTEFEMLKVSPVFGYCFQNFFIYIKRHRIKGDKLAVSRRSIYLDCKVNVIITWNFWTHNQTVLRLEKLEEFASIIVQRKKMQVFCINRSGGLKNCDRRNSFYEMTLNNLGLLFFWK